MARGEPAAHVAALVRPDPSEWWVAARSLAAGGAGQLAGIGLLATSGWLITTASLRPAVMTLMVAIGAVQAFSLSRGIARYGERLTGHDLALRILARVRTWSYDRIQPHVPGRMAEVRAGDFLARFVADVDGIMDIYVRAALPLLTASLSVGVTALVAGLLDRAAGLVILGGMVVAFGAGPVLGGVAARAGAVQLPELRGERDAGTAEALTGATELVAFGAAPSALARVASTDRVVNRMSVRMASLAGVGQALTAAMVGLLPAAVIAVSLPALRAGRLSGPAVAVLAFLALGVADASTGVPEAFIHLREGRAGAARVASIGAGDVCSWSSVVVDTTAPPAIECRDVTVLRPGRRRPVLDHLNLDVAPGDHLALIGPSGSGKTTLTHLLLGFLAPTEGYVALDGRPASEAIAGHLVAWAPQEAHIFGATVAENLRIARPDASDQELAEALQSVGLGAWLAALADGLATRLGERATTVSGGEAQRIGLARVLLADRPVLVLDEPTSHLDEATAHLVGQVLRRAAAGRTMIWITHDYREAEGFERVLSLCDGQVVESEATGAA